MTKFAIITPAVGVLLFASVATAQVYYPPTYVPQSYTPAPVSTSGCVILTTNLSFGSRGAEVTKLQQFLVSQNYPGGGSWMITGYFGQATTQAVRNEEDTSMGVQRRGEPGGAPVCPGHRRLRARLR